MASLGGLLLSPGLYSGALCVITMKTPGHFYIKTFNFKAMLSSNGPKIYKIPLLSAPAPAFSRSYPPHKWLFHRCSSTTRNTAKHRVISSACEALVRCAEFTLFTLTATQLRAETKSLKAPDPTMVQLHCWDEERFWWVLSAYRHSSKSSTSWTF